MLTAQRAYIAVVAVVIVFALSSFFVFREDGAVYDKITKSPLRSPRPTLQDTITTLFEPIKHDSNNPVYIDPSGGFYKGGEKAIWKRPLGKKVLIVDIDTRVPTGENQILNSEKLDWANLNTVGGGLVSSAIVNHYLYALIHGYDYKFYQARHMKDHHDTWIMPHVFRELIPDYDFVVAMDADVTISHLEVPLEWLFNRWGIKKGETSMALPWDTEQFRRNISISTDSKGLRVLNTGFVVAQNSPTTLELLEAWRDCTSETRYPGCSRWRYEWSHEQRAFSEYVRYDFNKTAETVISIPCDDAVGWPGFRKDMNKPNKPNEDVSDCNGNFVRHYTLGKSRVKDAGAGSVMQVLSEVLQNNIMANQRTTWYKEQEKRVEKPKHPQTEVRVDNEKKEGDATVLIEDQT
ncbi:hypothetical protein EJ02DRAFT_453387 [Clathrospora elynae]|uniref:Nucleotide-diphospho-sugar transferase domain-containing protein n=1 Tax=Clathrospora elynae TaxID=706981 RepID=A0A6A5SUF1_9PLEO|nr:hypothetical protein EJ02DRAFT_453387 [Clathrospora elynae]